LSQRVRIENYMFDCYSNRITIVISNSLLFHLFQRINQVCGNQDDCIVIKLSYSVDCIENPKLHIDALYSSCATVYYPEMDNKRQFNHIK